MSAETNVAKLADIIADRVADRLAEQTAPALIDANAAAELLGVPSSWVLAEARADRVPHVRLGRYVRFNPAELRAWAAERQRGPRARKGAA